MSPDLFNPITIAGGIVGGCALLAKVFDHTVRWFTATITQLHHDNQENQQAMLTLIREQTAALTEMASALREMDGKVDGLGLEIAGMKQGVTHGHT